MIMVPAENLYKQYLLGGGGGGGGSFYGGCGGGYTESLGVMSRINGYEYHGEACLGSDLGANPMAEDDSRTNSLTEGVSSSKDHIQEEKDEGWLQLSIGGQAAHGTSNENNNKRHEADPTAMRSGGLVELDLLSGGSPSQQAVTPPLGTVFHVPEFRPPPRPVMHSFSPSSFLFHQNQPQGSSLMFPHHHHQDISWPFRPITQSMAAAASSSSSSSSSSLVPFGWRPPFQVQTGMDVMAAGPSSIDIRIIDPPRRPHSGIWFMLQASQNQAKEPFLPQIPKSYLRIKDGKMTVRLLMKYLVNKLRLDSESEVEITCRGQQLLPFLTLQHVRDNIWSTRDAVTLLPESSSPSDHVMVLHYGRSAS